MRRFPVARKSLKRGRRLGPWHSVRTYAFGAVITVAAILLAVFFLPQPWGLVAIVAGAAIDGAETLLYMRWSQRRRARVGVEALLGRSAVCVVPLAPTGQVKIDGELWAARSDSPVDSGTEVLVRAVEGLTLLVTPRAE